MEKNQVAVYQRVSTVKQDNERQLTDITEYCQRENLTIVKSFDEKISGKIIKRPALTALFNFVKSTPSIKYVIFSELSRLGRNTEGVITNIKELALMNISCIFIKEGKKTINDDSRSQYFGRLDEDTMLLLTIIAGINTKFLSSLSYQVSSGLRNSAINGNCGGGTQPYGYMKDKTINIINGEPIRSKKMIINDLEAENVKLMFEMSLEGSGTMMISNYLNNKQIPSKMGAKWQDTSVYRILNNTIYTGNRRFKNELITAPAIISTELFEAVRLNLRAKGNKFQKGNVYTVLFDKKFIVCGCCGKNYYSVVGKPDKVHPVPNNVYRCLSVRYAESCGNIGVNIEKLERAVRNLLRDKYNTTLINQMIGESDLDKQLSDHINQLAEVEGFVSGQKRIQAKYADMYARDKISEELFDEKNNEASKEIVTLNNQLLTINTGVIKIKKQIDNLKNMKFDEDIDKDIIRQIVTGITIYPSVQNLCAIGNERVARVDIEIFQHITTILISNRCNDIEIYYPDRTIERKENI